MLRAHVPPLPELESARRQLPKGIDGAVRQELLGDLRARSWERNRAWYAAAIDEMNAVPGVDGIGTVVPTPFGRVAAVPVWVRAVEEDGQGRRDRGTPTLLRFVTPDTFRVLKIPIIAGRTFLPHECVPPRILRQEMGDATIGDDAAIVNRTFAERFWQTGNPVGEEFDWLGRRTVVGIVGDIHESIQTLDVQPTVYFPFVPMVSEWTFFVKLTPGTPHAVLATHLEHRLRALIPGLPATDADLLDRIIAEPLRDLRVALALLACFAVLGAVVAGLGVYATASEAAVTRWREVGIRVTLGASTSGVAWLTVLRSVRVTAIALPVGAFASWAVARTLSHQVSGVAVLDAGSVLWSAALLFTVAAVAALLVACRAARVHPADALRHVG